MGYLELIIGPMFAGKSTELIRKARNYKVINKKCLTINHILNSRYNSHKITTHDKLMLEACYNVGCLQEISIDDIRNADIILIEELQFYPDAYDTIIEWLDKYDKVIIAAGLDGDYNKQPFGDVLRLIPYANKVKKYSALCKLCGDGTLAPFTKKIKKDDNSIIQIGADKLYEAVCHKHYR